MKLTKEYQIIDIATDKPLATFVHLSEVEEWLNDNCTNWFRLNKHRIIGSYYNKVVEVKTVFYGGYPQK